MSDDLARWYREFHGRASVPVRAELAAPREVADLGELVAVTYRRPGGDLREHVFSPAARPVLVRDERGALHTLGGAYRVGGKGIADMSSSMVLHDTRPRYSRSGVPVLGRAIPREGLSVVRHNPIMGAMEAMRDGAAAVGDAVVVGGVATLGVQGSDALVARTPWSEGWRAAAQGLGLGLPGLLVIRSMPRTGSGLIAAALVGGVGRWARFKQWDRTAARWASALMGGAAPAAAAREGGAVYSSPLPFGVKVDTSERL